MPRIRHRKVKSVPMPRSAGIGKGGWVLIAATAIVVTGLSHAIADLAEPAREILGAKPHATRE